MTVQDYLRVLREQWVIVVSATVLAMIAVGAVASLRPPEYAANLTMYVSAQTADTANGDGAYQGSLLSQQRVASYVELVSSTRVSREVVRQLDLPQTPEQLARQINASSALDSVLIDVEVTDRFPERAAQVANSVGDVFTGLVDELERPTVADGVPPVVVRVVQPATVPTAPSSVGLAVFLALGLFVGLAVGFIAAMARNALDTSVKSPQRLREVTQAPVLGTIAYDPQVPKRPLTLHENPQSPRSEAFRQLRTNLQFVDVDHPRKVIVVTSSVPTEGKTTTVCNLAIAMAAVGSRILVIEGDLRRPKVADLLGIERSVGLTSILAGQVRVEQAIQRWAGGRFDVLASGPLPPNPSEILASEHTADLLEELREQYEMVLIDSPPLLPVTDAAAVAPATDGAILVCRFKQTSQGQVKAAVEALKAVSTPLLGTVFSMVPSSGSRAYAQYNAYYRTEEHLVSSGQNGFQKWTAPPQSKYAIRRQPNDSSEHP